MFPHPSRCNTVKWRFFQLRNALTWQPVFGCLWTGCAGFTCHCFVGTVLLSKELFPEMRRRFKGWPLGPKSGSIIGGYVAVRGGFPPPPRPCSLLELLKSREGLSCRAEKEETGSECQSAHQAVTGRSCSRAIGFHSPEPELRTTREKIFPISFS
jgi:hypothetical protein